MSKAKPSKLDPFAERLDRWFGVEKQSLEWVQEQLRLDGCSVSTGRLSQWWTARQDTLMREQLLASIATGANQCKEVEAMFGQSPPPETETLIKLCRVLIMKFSTQANTTPEMCEIVFNMLKPVIKWHEVQLKEGALSLEKQKFEIVICEKFLAWFKDQKAREVAESAMGNAQKIAALRQLYFADVDALQKSGKVVLPQ